MVKSSGGSGRGNGVRPVVKEGEQEYRGYTIDVGRVHKLAAGGYSYMVNIRDNDTNEYGPIFNSRTALSEAKKYIRTTGEELRQANRDWHRRSIEKLDRYLEEPPED